MAIYRRLKDCPRGFATSQIVVGGEQVVDCKVCAYSKARGRTCRLWGLPNPDLLIQREPSYVPKSDRKRRAR